MPRSGFSVIIAASDKTAGAIDSVNRRLAQIRAPAERVQKSLAKFGQLSGISEVSKGLNQIGRNAAAVASSITRVIEPLAAVTSIASIAGVYRMVTAWGEFGTTLRNAAARIGVSTTDLYALQGAAGATGASAEAMTGSLSSMSQAIYDAIGGRNAEALAMFNQLSIAFQDGNRRALPLTGTLHKVADQIKRVMDVGDPQAALRIMRPLGLDPSLIPLLSQGGDAIDRYMAKSRAYADMTKQQAEAANKLRESQYWLGRSIEGTENQISAAISPVVAPMIDELSNYIKDHRPQINRFVREEAGEFQDWVKGGGLRRIEDDLYGIGKRADAVAQYFGGWKAVIEDIMAIMSARFAVAFLTPFAQIGIGALKLTNAMRLLLTASRQATAAGEAAVASETVPMGFLASTGITVGGLIYNAATETGADKTLEEGHRFRAGKPGAYVYPSSATPNTAQQAVLERVLYAQAIKLGDTPDQAAAWLSQAKRESSYNPGAVNGNHYGLFQWDPERQAAFEKYTGHSIVGSSPVEQLEFAHHEVMTKYPKAREALDENKNYAPGAALGLQDYFEMTDNPGREAAKSVDFARDIMARLPAISVPATTAAAPGAPGTAGATGRVDVHIRTDDKGRVKATASGNVNPPKIDGPLLGPTGF